jgi:hypothetical protein
LTGRVGNCVGTEAHEARQGFCWARRPLASSRATRLMREATRAENGKALPSRLTDASPGQGKELPRRPRTARAPALGLAPRIEGRTTVLPAKKILRPSRAVGRCGGARSKMWCLRRPSPKKLCWRCTVREATLLWPGTSALSWCAVAARPIIDSICAESAFTWSAAVIELPASVAEAPFAYIQHRSPQLCKQAFKRAWPRDREM